MTTKPIEKESEKFAPSNLFEGMVSIRALIESRENGTNDRPIHEIYIDDTKLASRRRERAYLTSKGLSITLCRPSLIDSMAIGNTHGGILASCGDRTIPALTPEAAIRPDGFYVLMEGIEDPYNFGYALRSLYASGADGIVLTPRNWMGAAGIVCRASAGASERLPMYISDAAEAAQLFHNFGYRVICADKNDAVSVFETDLRLPIFLIVGGEKRGVSRAVLDHSDAIVRLDYGRKFPAALSAASAASILAYEVLRQNRGR